MTLTPAGQKYSLFRHLATAFWPNLNGREALFMVYGITAYYDASSKEEVKEKPLVVVGIASTAAKWTAFEQEWAAVLKRENVEYHDTAACMAWDGPYSDWGFDVVRRDAYLIDLAGVLKNVATQVVVGYMTPSDFDAVNETYRLDEDEHWPSPYPLLTHWCLAWIAKTLERSALVTPGYELAHLIEKGDTGQGVIQRLIDQSDLPIAIAKKWNKSTGKKIHAFAACDLYAWHARRAVIDAGQGLTPPNVVEVLRTIPPASVNFDRQALIEWCERLPELYPKRA